MNILVDIRSLLDKPYTGVAQYTLNFLNESLEQDKENNYFLFYNSAKYSNKDLPQFSYPNVRIIDTRWPNKFFNFFLWLFKWPKIDKLVEKKIGQKIDEVFLPNFNFSAFSKNKKITLAAHDLSFEIYPHFFTFKQRLWHKLVNPRKLCQQATKIITHSENTKNDIIRFYKINPAKIEVKSPPLNSKFRKTSGTQSLQEKPATTEALNSSESLKTSEILRSQAEYDYMGVKDKYKLPNDFILYLGNLEPRKNLDTLIRAFSQLNNLITNNITYLVIAGQGREMSKLKRLTKDLGVGDRVKFLGYVSEEGKLALYNLAKVFVYPSFYEGYGYPVAEALACGIPVITSHTSSLTEIESGKIIFINPYDINDLTEAITRSQSTNTSE